MNSSHQHGKEFWTMPGQPLEHGVVNEIWLLKVEIVIWVGSTFDRLFFGISLGLWFSDSGGLILGFKFLGLLDLFCELFKVVLNIYTVIPFSSKLSGSYLDLVNTKILLLASYRSYKCYNPIF